MVSLHLISVVDDDESMRQSLCTLLRSVGFGVKVFSSAEAFLHSDEPRNTDCLILDVRMPGMDGFELHRRLAADKFSIPVIYVTAHGDDAGRQRALSAGAVDYLLKPFSEQALLNAVDKALKQ